MKHWLIGFSLVLGAAVAVAAQDAREVVLQQAPFAVHSAFWPNLHQTLWAESSGLSKPGTGHLTPEERKAWDAAIAYYKKDIADLHPLFEMGPIRKVILSIQTEVPATGLMPPHREALMAAMPVYRKHWWPEHDRANRAWVADPFAKVASLSPAVPDRLVKLYGTDWFTSTVRVDVVRNASREGAFTSIDPPPAHITMSSASEVLTGWTAAEILFHEASHALVFPMLKAFDAELKAQGKKAPVLWHVALFYLTGEVVRQTLAERGDAYEPYLYKTGLFDRAWPQFKAAIETYWKPYIDGKLPRDEAIKNVVSEIK